MKKILCVLLVVLMCLTAAPLGGFADLDLGITASALNATGKCGKTATYTFDSATGKLTIEGTGKINAEAFYSNQDIKEVVIGDGITEIGADAFNNCDYLTTIDLGKTVTVIGDNAFCNCYYLTGIEIPDSVITIGNDAFCDCDNLKSVVIGNGVTIIGAQAFYSCDNLASVIIGDSVTTIGDCAFQYCDKLTSVIIPDGVLTIELQAFYHCSNLASVVIGNGVETIEGYAFAYCNNLTSVTVGNRVKSIDGNAFYNCTSLESINIPKTVIFIGGAAFRYCPSLYDVYYEGSEEEWNAIYIGEYNTGIENATIHFGEDGETPAECVHVWSAATCVAPKTCAICGKTLGVALSVHTWNAGEVTTAPTCKTKGIKTFECTVEGCTATKTEEVDKVAHNYKEEITHATCLEDGYSTFTCTMCGSYYVDKAVTAYGHMFETYFYDEGSATCYQDGTKTAECANGCGAKNTVAVPSSKTDHKMTDFILIEQPTCTEFGEKEAKCINFDYCGYSIIEYVETLAHDYEGVEFIKFNDRYHAKMCKNCNEFAFLTFHDDWELKSTKLSPTCTEDGVGIYECKDCKATMDDVIFALGHDMSKIEGYHATCTESGMNTYYACKRCDKFFKDKNGRIETTETDEIVAPYGHDYWDIDSKQETCTEDGYWVWKCFDCGHTYTETIPATGHSYPSTWSVLITPDCQNTGFAVKVCFGCHDVIAQVVPKAGHADNDGDSHCDTCNCEIIVKEPETPDEPADDSADEPADEPEEKPCDCNCHAGGIKAFFFKLTNFFAKIFSKDARTCKCGKSH